MATDEAVEVGGHRIFEDTYCRLIAFDFELDSDNFDLGKFTNTFDPFTKNAQGKEPQPRLRNTCGTRYKNSDYHLHLTWHREKGSETINLTVEFAWGYKEPEQNEREPLAEDFFAWLVQFIKVNEIHAEMYSDFIFPLQAGRKAKFPLPMKAPVGPEAVEAEIDGISFKLVPSVQGVEKVWITQEEDNLSVHLHGERLIDIKRFDPRSDVLEITAVMDSMFKPRRAGGEEKIQ